MTTGSLDGDQITHALASLPKREPDPQRTIRTRERCHAALCRVSGKERVAGYAARLSVFRVLEPALVGLVSAVYLSEVVRRAWLLYGF